MSEMTDSKSKKQLGLWGCSALVLLLLLGGAGFLAGQYVGSSGDTATMPTATPLPAPVVTINGIKAKADLEAVEYSTITEVYVENVPDSWLDSNLGTKEELLMLVYGDVRGGFNLDELTAEHLWMEGDQVKLVLPAPKILNSSIDFERSHIIYYENSILLDDSNPNLQGEALERAKAALEQAALEGGILEQSNRYGQLYFENLLYSLGFTTVEVVTDAQIFKE